MNPKAKGMLTAAQFEIMEVSWEAGTPGATVQEIWRRISERRAIGRTTVLNQVDRLEKRGWLRRMKGDGARSYAAAITRGEAIARLTGRFVADFFDGSASHLVQSLLGSEKLDDRELGHLQDLLAEETRNRGRKDRMP